MLLFFRRIYYRSPLFLQKLIFLIPKGLIFGRNYRHHSQILRSSANLADRRKETLAALRDFKFPLQSVSLSFEDNWMRIPFMDKSEKHRYLGKAQIKSFAVTTGGVTGKPARFIQNNEVWYKELAYIDYMFENLGLNKGELKLSFRGGEFGLSKNGIWYVNPLHQEICFSPFRLNGDALKVLNAVLVKYKPKIWYGYPSAFKTLFTQLDSESVQLSLKPETLLLISESFTKADCIWFKTHLPETRITSFYGLSERCAFGFPMEGDVVSGYVLDTNYSYVELIDNDGQVITEPGVIGELVATSYDNIAMPLIRYRTGDYTKWIDYSKRTIDLIEGKWNGKSLIDQNGGQISVTAINFHDGEWDKVTLVQFLQIAPGLVSVSIQGVSEHVKKNLIDSLNHRVGGTIQFNQNPTNEFIKTKRGKIPLIVLDESLSNVEA